MITAISSAQSKPFQANQIKHNKNSNVSFTSFPHITECRGCQGVGVGATVAGIFAAMGTYQGFTSDNIPAGLLGLALVILSGVTAFKSFFSAH